MVENNDFCLLNITEECSRLYKNINSKSYIDFCHLSTIRISIILAHYRNLQKLGKLELDIRFIHYSHISIYDAVYN